MSKEFDSINLTGSIYQPEHYGVNFRQVPGSVSNTSEEENDDDDDDFNMRKYEDKGDSKFDDYEPNPVEFLSGNNPIHIRKNRALGLHNNLGSSSGVTPTGLTPTDSTFEYNQNRMDVSKVPNIQEDVLFLNPSVISGSDGPRQRSEDYKDDDVVKQDPYSEGEYGEDDDDGDDDNAIYNGYPRSLSHTLHIPSSHRNGYEDGDESPVEFLLNRGKILHSELSKNIDLQSKMLSSGDSRLSKVRLMISQNFDQIAENNESLYELYSKDLQNISSLYESFQNWEVKRNKVLKKIKLIKSPQHNKYGKKLAELADKSNEIDLELVELEKKIASLKVKRSTIHQEIENTSSILESRTSSYVEAFKNLEFQGEQAIQLILDLNRVSRVEQTNIIKKVPVDVTFANNYKPDMSSESLFKSEPQISKSAQVTLNQSRPANVGMQAYIIPEDPIPSILTTELPKMLPYDKGYAMGTNISHNAKTFVKDILIPKINNTVNTYSKKSSGLRPPVLDDQNNTISEMLELAPILNLLDFKTKALKDLIVQHSTIAKSFREYSVIWKDVIDLVGHMENDLYSHISSSVINGPDRIALSILSLCLGNVRTRFEVQVETSKHTNGGNSLFTVLLNEIKAIVTAISMVSGDKSYLQIITDLESMSGINKDQPTSSYKTVSSSYPIPTGFINTGINERAKAEIELSKGKPLEISFPSQYQILKKDKLI